MTIDKNPFFMTSTPRILKQRNNGDVVSCQLSKYSTVRCLTVSISFDMMRMRSPTKKRIEELQERQRSCYYHASKFEEIGGCPRVRESQIAVCATCAEESNLLKIRTERLYVIRYTVYREELEKHRRSAPSYCEKYKSSRLIMFGRI